MCEPKRLLKIKESIISDNDSDVAVLMVQDSSELIPNFTKVKSKEIQVISIPIEQSKGLGLHFMENLKVKFCNSKYLSTTVL